MLTDMNATQKKGRLASPPYNDILYVVLPFYFKKPYAYTFGSICLARVESAARRALMRSV